MRGIAMAIITGFIFLAAVLDKETDEDDAKKWTVIGFLVPTLIVIAGGW